MKKFFYCHSLNLVSYILANGIEPEGKVKEEGKSAMFYFEKTDELTEIVNKYNNDIEMKKFIAAFKRVKDMIRN